MGTVLSMLTQKMGHLTTATGKEDLTCPVWSLIGLDGAEKHDTKLTILVKSSAVLGGHAAEGSEKKFAFIFSYQDGLSWHLFALYCKFQMYENRCCRSRETLSGEGWSPSIDSTSVNRSVPSSHGVALAPGTVVIYVCSKRVNWVWGACPQNFTAPEIVSACNLGMELTTKPIVSVSQYRQALFGEVRLSHDSTWLLTRSTAAGVSGLTWSFYYYLAATGRAGILTVRQGLCPARPCRRYTTEAVTEVNL